MFRHLTLNLCNDSNWQFHWNHRFPQTTQASVKLIEFSAERLDL